MAANTSILDAFDIASPCTASWHEMHGDAFSRFCRHCSKHVYDISQLTRARAEALIREKEGRLCVRFYRRRDGRIKTQDCPAARPSSRKPVVLCLILAFLVIIAQLIFTFFSRPDDHVQPTVLRRFEPFRTIMEWIDPQPVIKMGVDLSSGILLEDDGPPPPRPFANFDK